MNVSYLLLFAILNDRSWADQGYRRQAVGPRQRARWRVRGRGQATPGAAMAKADRHSVPA